MNPGRYAHTAGVAVICLLIFCVTRPAHAAPDYVPGEVLVGLRDLSRQGFSVGRVTGSHSRLGVSRVELTPGYSISSAIAELRRNPNVVYAEPNYIRRITTAPNDPNFQYSQYAPQRIMADKAWDVWQPQSQVIIAVVDTGIEYGHSDLKNVLLRNTSGSVIGYNVFNKGTNASDDHGHGTHVSGIAAGQINNALGIAGIAGWNPAIQNSGNFVKLMPVKALDSAGAGSDSGLADGITWAADNGARVINLSLGAAFYSNTVNSAVQYAWSKGCVIVAAAGNASSSTVYYPAGYNNVISVASTDATDTLSYFSNYGSWVKTAAPGAAVLSTWKGDYTRLSGTSMATPHVVGEAAMLIAQSPSLTNSQVNSLITSNVDSYLPYQGRTLGSGAGRINVQKALQALAPPVYTVSTSCVSVNCGGALSVSWTAPGGRPANDWIGLFKAGDPNTMYGWWSFTGGATNGTINLTAPAQTGTYEFRYLIAGGYTDTARSSQFKVEQVTPGYVLTASTTSVTAGGSISVSWSAPAGRPTTDWIGLFAAGSPNTAYGWWKYTQGAQSGSFNLIAPVAAGTYEFRYLLNNGYTDSARSGQISVTSAGSNYSVSVDRTSVAPGGTVSVSWTAPSGRPYNDWVGIFKVGDPNTAYGWWKYTGGSTSGTFTMTAPSTPGHYEFRYLLQNGFTDSARSSAVTVGS